MKTASAISALCIALHYNYSAGLNSISGNAPSSGVAGQSFAYKAFGIAQITSFAEIELDRITITIDGDK
ncbi:hypothetical protein J2782_002916 [Brucella pseudogrignonensis]|uniref:Uncharacterized protein n=1 Tax=Brucella pseudogrignonensis TaxID=419475 RepID=A0ABU1MAV5_9HYPH|nr:hypothetical protein [Brucella pseudogrignonensis]